MTLSASDLMEELNALATVTNANGTVIEVYDEDDMLDRLRAIRYPALAIGWEGSYPVENAGNPRNGGQQGLATGVGLEKMRFTITVAVDYNTPDGISVDPKREAMDILRDLKTKIRGYKKVNKRPWVMIAEGPMSVKLENAAFYYQMWETEIIVKGGDA